MDPALRCRLTLREFTYRQRRQIRSTASLSMSAKTIGADQPFPLFAIIERLLFIAQLFYKRNLPRC
jgi:hypothetical protein